MENILNLKSEFKKKKRREYFIYFYKTRQKENEKILHEHIYMYI